MRVKAQVTNGRRSPRQPGRVIFRDTNRDMGCSRGKGDAHSATTFRNLNANRLDATRVGSVKRGSYLYECLVTSFGASRNLALFLFIGTIVSLRFLVRFLA